MMIFKQKALKFEGNWLLTGPNEIPTLDYGSCSMPVVPLHSEDEANPINFRPQRRYGSQNGTQRETLGTVETHTYTCTSSTMDSTRQRNTGSYRNGSQPFSVDAQDGYRMDEEEEEENEDEEQI